jgi:hypothetical protein
VNAHERPRWHHPPAVRDAIRRFVEFFTAEHRLIRVTCNTLT